MKLLLTSAGFQNDSIKKALIELTERPLDKLNLAFVPTASNVEEGDKGWLIEDYVNCQKLGLASVDIVDISALPENIWKKRLENADILLFGGGNTFHLMHWLERSRLKELLPELLKTKIYVGISAGSCVTGKTIYNSVQNLFDEKYDLQIKNGLGLVDFQFIPHLNSPYFTKIRVENLREASKDLNETVYAADDNTAVRVVDGEVSVVSEGQWEKFN